MPTKVALPTMIGDEMMTDELRAAMNNCSIEKLMYALKHMPNYNHNQYI